MPFAGIKGRLNGHDLEQVRAEFVTLYIDEDKELKDVVEHFRGRGIHASQQQWKSQIALWKIHKNNRETQMIFAARKAEHRLNHLGKDTVFRINGQLRTVHDVARYLKRRRRAKEATPPSILTPEAITYFTPCQSPSVNTSQLEHPLNSPSPDRTVNPDNSTASNIEDLDSTTCSRRHTEKYPDAEDIVRSLDDFEVYLTKVLHQRSLSSSLTLSDDLYAVESGLHAVREFYGMTIPKHFGDDSIARGGQTNSAYVFYQKMHSYHVHMELQNIFTAQTFHNDALKVLQRISSSLRPDFLVWFIHVLLDLDAMASQPLTLEFLYSCHRIFLQSLSKTHPLTEIVKAMETTGVNRWDLVERYLVVGVDALRKNHHEAIRVSYYHINALAGVFGRVKGWHGVLRASNIAKQLLNFHHCDDDEMKLSIQLECYRKDALAYLSLEHYPEAVQILDRYGKAIEQAPYLPDKPRMDYLAVRGEVQRRIGRDTDGMKDLHAAWRLAYQTYGPADGETVNRFRHLDFALRGGGNWNFGI